MRKFLTFCLQNPCKNAKKQTGAGRKGVPACSGLFYQEKSSNEDILGGELFSSENNIAHPSEKCKPFFEKNRKNGKSIKMREKMHISAAERRAVRNSCGKTQFGKFILAKSAARRYNEKRRLSCGGQALPYKAFSIIVNRVTGGIPHG